MFQSFDSSADPRFGAARLAALRAELKRNDLDGFLVPLADEHQGEYIPPSAQRLAWLTGFGGSAGLCAVLADKAAIFVDGRYTIQVRQQVNTEVFEPKHLMDEPVGEWLKENVGAGRRIGYDPWLHTMAEVARLEKALKKVGAFLVAVDRNPIDAVWGEQPNPPVGPVSLYPDQLAGETSAVKIERIGKAVAEADADAAVLTMTDSIAWVFNIRGSDIGHTPVPLAFAILQAEGRPLLFIDGQKLSNSVRAALDAVVDIAEPDQFTGALEDLGRDERRVLIDPSTAAAKIGTLLKEGGAKLVEGEDPVTLPKAIKNEAELAGTRGAHIRDGAAMVRFLAWLDEAAPAGSVDEVIAAEKLEEFRRDTGALKEISFDTISAAGPHAAIPHYRVTRESCLPLKMDEIFLIDSGGQYEDGTTDITRTVIVGTPSAEMRDRYTRVLKGMIAISRARFPKGTTGAHLDILARQALWNAGFDFDHGTGHGVGVYLSVHEGPQRISKASHVKLQPGMILSNEPGYYKDGAYGIRIENLVIVTAEEPIEGGERPMMGFETLTFAPIDKRLVDVSLMDEGEISWFDRYHAEVREKLMPLVSEEDGVRGWLLAATEPLGPR
ncbi:Xaa-Pro dipeptidase [Hartmannibacter diazotrophicus]|uniref:Xaa-Pro dipeptidase n=1 Tax=Hartmannibacter diazotrophicus TaxID=1482074 RepID=A0A2C9D7Y4_9HYPH|nr:aminopeptidase P family protein [Hartmannibacter diazotrophicus]SON56432.1 Xaa-Pro dipeptidase [Hartmannibacter diazotrophicus]